MLRAMMVVMAVCILGTAPASAQESDIRVGFGVSVAQNLSLVPAPDGASGYTPISFATVSVPVFLTKNFRIEPEVGYLSGSRERTYSDKTTSTSSFSQIRFGAAVHYFLDKVGGSENVTMYIGPEVAFSPISSKSKSATAGATEDTYSQSNTVLGIVLGGEYFFAKRFSAGAAVHLNYLIIGEEDPLLSVYSDVSESYINVATALQFRFYFN